MKELTEREKYIKESMFSNLKENEASAIVKKISSIGDSIGFIGSNVSQDEEKYNKRKHKYDVWIAKEVKKNLDIIDMAIELRLIVDWASETSADIFSMSFDQAFEAQEAWHEEMMIKHQIQRMEVPEIDESRVVFRFSDKKHFLYLLKEDDLKYEGNAMGHCVGGTNYISRVRDKKSLILSIRDQNNTPRVTIEVDVDSRKVSQKYGRGNKEPVQKYLKMYGEYALFVTDFKSIKNKNVLKFLNLNLFKNN